ncbi:hypothetical protein F511_30199 [Dorcoceras hygrometricum]|uniref:Uncharacterized protein n=1 Tax=Dorcoceras hygrometricum TaxID=472368 RepID=A0A2Z7CDM8_9LAMI|nr:hypothetical protein F511_30199 [Dorcoceras hygrometricum]
MAEVSSSSSMNTTSLHDRILELETRMQMIESLLGAPTGKPTETIYQQVEGLLRAVESNVGAVADLSTFVETRMVSAGEEIESKVDGFELELNLLKKTVGAGSTPKASSSTKFKVLEPKVFAGVGDPDPPPDPRLLRQTALEVLTRSARSDSPRKTRTEQIPAKLAAAAAAA